MTGTNDHAASNEQLVRDFVAAWPRLDPEEIAAFFTDDGVYHNIPMAPVAGRENVLALLRGFMASWTATTWDIINLAAAGDVVITERIDHIDAGGKHVDLPVAGVFEIRDGKIAAWRDYFDFATYRDAMF